MSSLVSTLKVFKFRIALWDWPATRHGVEVGIVIGVVTCSWSGVWVKAGIGSRYCVLTIWDCWPTVDERVWQCGCMERGEYCDRVMSGITMTALFEPYDRTSCYAIDERGWRAGIFSAGRVILSLQLTLCLFTRHRDWCRCCMKANEGWRRCILLYLWRIRLPWNMDNIGLRWSPWKTIRVMDLTAIWVWPVIMACQYVCLIWISREPW